MNRTQKFARLALLTGASVGALSAHAADYPDAVSALGSLSTNATGFGPIMFGLAVTVTGIMIGVKWIKRGKAAA